MPRRIAPLLAALALSCGDSTGGVETPDPGGGTPLADATPPALDLRVTDVTMPEDDLKGFGEPCNEARECESGYCIEAASEGRICTQSCGECPPGYECSAIANGGPDLVFLCTADQPDLCKPCETDLDCDDTADLCLRIGEGLYCGEDCAGDGLCPEGYACEDILDDTGAVRARQCKPANGGGCAGCRDDDGDRHGEGADCLDFDCDDADPSVYRGAPELCDGKDNNCNARTDEAEVLEIPVDLAPCLTDGVCAGTPRTCVGGAWTCAYPPTYGGAGPEGLCDGLDNDCDALADEDFDLTTDPRNCGVCGAICAFPHAEALCTNRVCEPGPCEAGWNDADGNRGNGCEYLCVPTRDGQEFCDGEDNDCDTRVDEGTGEVEVCDAADNDCDEQVDEGFDLSTDAANCGRCGAACVYPNGAARCEAGGCVVGPCAGGYVDANGRADDGCEYLCIETNGGVEACDQIDNDCDGTADEGLAQPETCNLRDDDCDAVIDEGFDLATDDQNCGICGNACVVPNAAARCLAASCRITECVGGFLDVDGLGENGCEYGCFPSNNGTEVCDGIDNDCDVTADEGFELSADVENCGACGRSCLRDQAQVACDAGRCVVLGCDEGFVDLDGVDENGCEFECSVQNGGAEVCNGVDDDCDARTDEGLLNACGQCGPLPAEVCNFADDDCDARTDEGTLNRCGGCGPEPAEVCNGVDDDCDGQVDNRGVCGGFVQGACRVFVGWSDENRGPVGASANWHECPGSDAAYGDRIRCVGTRRDGNFVKLDLAGDVDDNDRLAFAFLCDDGNNADLARWTETHCAVYLGYTDNDRGPDNVAAWGACPPSINSDNAGLRCTSSGYDRQFRKINLEGDVDGNDDFAVAFICRDDANPTRAASVQRSVDFFMGWADSNRGPDSGSQSWGPCPGAAAGQANGQRCTSSNGDGNYHRIDMSGDVGGDDDFGFALRARPAN